MAPFVPSVMDCLLTVLRGREATAALPGSDGTLHANEAKLTSSTATSASAVDDAAEEGGSSLVEVCAQVMVDMVTHCTSQAGDSPMLAGAGIGKRQRDEDGSSLSPSGTSECPHSTASFSLIYLQSSATGCLLGVGCACVCVWGCLDANVDK